MRFRSRRGSLDATRTGTRGLGVLVAVFLVVAAIVLVGMYLLPSTSAGPAQARVQGPATTISAVVDPDAAGGHVEVPNLVGRTVLEAKTIVSAAGLVARFKSSDASLVADTDTVIEQQVAPGAILESGGELALVVRTGAQGVVTSASGKSKRKKVYVVCIDPGHQTHSDSGPEPIGPRAKKVKPRSTGGTTGAVTKVPEYEVTLQIAMNLKAQLEARGVKVIMTRTVNDVLLSNAERAAVANKAKADLFVRLHCNGNPRTDVSGVCTLYPAKRGWTKKLAAPSRRAALAIQGRVVDRTQAVDRGVSARTDQAGFNWSKVPSVLVDCGFMSNPVEDRLLVSPHYQDKLGEGMADGIMAYLESGDR